jgi:hypothetical protein
MDDSIECPGDDNIPLSDLLSFALSYNAYARLAQDPEHLVGIVQPVLAELEHGQDPPAWAGLDLLRGALFYIQRQTHHWGDVPREQESQMRSLLSAIRRIARGRLLSADDLP